MTSPAAPTPPGNMHMHFTPAELAVMRNYCARVVTLLGWNKFDMVGLPPPESMCGAEVLLVLARAFSSWSARMAQHKAAVPKLLMEAGLYNNYVAEELAARIKELDAANRSKTMKIATLQAENNVLRAAIAGGVPVADAMAAIDAPAAPAANDRTPTKAAAAKRAATENAPVATPDLCRPSKRAATAPPVASLPAAASAASFRDLAFVGIAPAGSVPRIA
jgi:hypothetical protein